MRTLGFVMSLIVVGLAVVYFGKGLLDLYSWAGADEELRSIWLQGPSDVRPRPRVFLTMAVGLGVVGALMLYGIRCTRRRDK